MATRKNQLIVIAIVAILFACTGTCYLSGLYILQRLTNSTLANTMFTFLGYVFQAVGMITYSFLFNKYNSRFNYSYSSITIIVIELLAISIIQISRSVLTLVVASVIFNFLTGMIFSIYLILLTSNIDKKHRGLYFGISYAIGSIFTFFATYVDGGKFVESPSMAVVYATLFTIACLLLLKVKKINVKAAIEVDNFTIKYSRLLLITIAVLTIVMSLGDGIYNFGVWTSDVDLRIVRIVYAFGLIIAGIINDKDKRLSSIITYACLSYYLISIFLINSFLSSTVIMSLGYFFMGFIAVYRYTIFADLTDEYPQYLSYCGIGLAVSRVAEALAGFLMFIYPLTLYVHAIVTVICYSPLVILAVILDNMKYSKSIPTVNSKLAKFSEEYGFTSREQELYSMILDNATDDEIAKKLYISKPTVRFHISNILKKTNTKSRVQAKRLFEKF